MWTKKNRSGSAAPLGGKRRVLLRRSRGAEEPALDRQTTLAHRRLRRRGMQEQVVKEQHVPGLEDRPHDPRLSRRLLSNFLRDRPVEVRTLLTAREDAVESPRDDVHAGRFVTAVREREP